MGKDPAPAVGGGARAAAFMATGAGGAWGWVQGRRRRRSVAGSPANVREASLVARAAPAVVDVVDESRPLGGLVPEILEKVDREGVPVRDQRMEYVRSPKRSPLRGCGIPGLEGEDGVSTLVTELLARGVGEDSAEVGAAAACLMLGGVDEAHNLVTPHCWTSPTTFAGPPKAGSQVQREAAYCQVIVHRMEGSNNGEFGTGFHNSGYWIAKAFGSTGHPLFPELRAAAGALAEGKPDAQSTMRTMGPLWKPALFNKLCEEALLTEEPDLLTFCSAVQAKELQLLFDYVASGRAATAARIGDEPNQ